VTPPPVVQVPTTPTVPSQPPAAPSVPQVLDPITGQLVNAVPGVTCGLLGKPVCPAGV
jgi:hypothetical protein